MLSQSPLRSLPRLQLLVLSGVGVLMAGVTATWILADDSLNSFADAVHHHKLAMDVALALQRDGLHGGWQVLEAGHVAWPPGVFALHGLGGYVFGAGYHALRLTNLLYIPLLLGLVYALGRRWGSSRTAGLAAVLTITSLGVAFHLRHICIDNPATVAVILAMLALTLAARDPRPRSWVLLGAACGLGLLFRVQVLFFVALPVAAVAGWHLWKAETNPARLRLAGWMALSAVVTLVVSSPYWGPRPGLFLTVALSHVGIYLPQEGLVHEQASAQRLDLLNGLGYYTWALVRLTGWPVVLVALATLPRLLRNRPQACLLWLCIIGGVVAYSATISREPRYLLPAVPALVLLALMGLEQFSRRLAVILSLLLLLGTTGPMLILAGLFEIVPKDSVATLLYHHKHMRQVEVGQQVYMMRRLARSFRPKLEARGRGINRLIVSRNLGEIKEELIIHLAPWLPSMEYFIPDEQPCNVQAPTSRGSPKRPLKYYLLSGKPISGLPQDWDGQLASTWVGVYGVPQDHLLRIMEAQRELALGRAPAR